MQLHRSWLDAHHEWGPGLHEDGFGLAETDEVESAAGFADWVDRLSGPASTDCLFRWILRDGEVAGGIVLRHNDTKVTEHLGHVGYGICPSARRKGLASWALGEVIGLAPSYGLDRLLIVCDMDNVASARTIEHHGGLVEDHRHSGYGRMRRYWIDA